MASASSRARKAATNLSLRADLVQRAKSLKINLSSVKGPSGIAGAGFDGAVRRLPEPTRQIIPAAARRPADLLSDLATRVVVPMAPKRSWAAARLSRVNPTATVERREDVLVFQELAAVPRSALGEPVASLAARRSGLIAALDVLFTGV